MRGLRFRRPTRRSIDFRRSGTYRTDIEPEIRDRALFTEELEQQLLLTLSSIVDRRNFKDVLFLLSKVHYEYDVPAERTYTWLSKICRDSGDELLAANADLVAGYMIDARACPNGSPSTTGLNRNSEHQH